VRQTVRLEAIGLVAVLAITAVLVNVTPASTAAGVDGLFSETKPFGEDYELNLVVDPSRVGQNEVHLYIYDDTGAPLTDDPFDSVLLRLMPPGEGLGAIEREPQYILPGHYTLAGNELSIPGRWNIEAEAREGEFGLLTAAFDVRVSG
jgi:copper transport protein